MSLHNNVEPLRERQQTIKQTNPHGQNENKVCPRLCPHSAGVRACVRAHLCTALKHICTDVPPAAADSSIMTDRATHTYFTPLSQFFFFISFSNTNVLHLQTDWWRKEGDGGEGWSLVWQWVAVCGGARAQTVYDILSQVCVSIKASCPGRRDIFWHCAKKSRD